MRNAFSIRPSSTCRSRRASARTGIVAGDTATVEGYPLGIAAQRPDPSRLGDQSSQVHGAQVEAEVVRAEPREVEQVAHEAVQPLRLALHPSADLLHLRAGDDAVGERLGEAGDGGERRTQLVRHGHQEVALAGFAVLQRGGETVERRRHLRNLERPFDRDACFAVPCRHGPGHLGGTPQGPGEGQRASSSPATTATSSPTARATSSRPREVGALRRAHRHRLDEREAAGTCGACLHQPGTAVELDRGGHRLTRGHRIGPGLPDAASAARQSTHDVRTGHGHPTRRSDLDQRHALTAQHRRKSPYAQPRADTRVGDLTLDDVRLVRQRRREHVPRRRRDEPAGEHRGDTDRDDGDKHAECGDLHRQRRPPGRTTGRLFAHGTAGRTSAAYPTPRTVRIGLAAPSFARSCATCTSTVRVPAGAS